MTGAFPSACGKTNLAMLVPTDARVEGRDDRGRHLLDEDRPRRDAAGDQPGGRFLRRRARHEHEDQPERGAHARRQLHLHEHGAHRRRRRLVGGPHRRAARAPAPTGGATTGRRRSPRRPRTRTPASPLRRARTRPSRAEWEDPDGVPISAILFGGRRASVVPLVHEAFDWAHGVFLGSIMASETTAAADGRRRQAAARPVRDAALLRLQHGRLLGALARRSGTGWTRRSLPRIFYVNWFRKTADGRFLWPGFGENSRVLEWVFERCAGRGDAVETPIGYLPAPGAIDLEGLEVSAEDMSELLACRPRRVASRAAPDRGVLRPVRRPAARGHLRPARGAEKAPRLTAGRAQSQRSLSPSWRSSPVLAAPDDRRDRAVRLDHRVVAGGKAREHRGVDRGLPARPRQHPHMGALVTGPRPGGSPPRGPRARPRACQHERAGAARRRRRAPPGSGSVGRGAWAPAARHRMRCRTGPGASCEWEWCCLVARLAAIARHLVSPPRACSAPRGCRSRPTGRPGTGTSPGS